MTKLRQMPDSRELKRGTYYYSQVELVFFDLQLLDFLVKRLSGNSEFRWVRPGDMGYTTYLSLQIEIPQIMIRKADQTLCRRGHLCCRRLARQRPG